MRVTVTIDDQLVASAKESARLAGQTLSEFIEESIRMRLAKRSHPETPALPVFTRGTGLRPGLNPTSNRSLDDALDNTGDLL